MFIPILLWFDVLKDPGESQDKMLDRSVPSRWADCPGSLV